MAIIHEITSVEELKDALSNNKIVILDFWAPWCGPCKMLTPLLEEIAEDFKDKEIYFCKANTDESQVLAASFGIRSIPTVIFFKEGKVVEALVGVRPKQNYIEQIEKLL